MAGAWCAEFELVACEGERTCAVAIRRVTRQDWNGIDADAHLGRLSAADGDARTNAIQHFRKLFAKEDGDDGGRRFMRAEAVVVVRRSGRGAQEIAMDVHGADDGCEKRQENSVFLWCLAWIEKVFRAVGKPPVVVFARTIDARERLFVEETDETVPLRNLS